MALMGIREIIEEVLQTLNLALQCLACLRKESAVKETCTSKTRNILFLRCHSLEKDILHKKMFLSNTILHTLKLVLQWLARLRENVAAKGEMKSLRGNK